MRVSCSTTFDFKFKLIPTLVISDEFADVKAVKLLRRGRRLQQAE